MNAADIQKCTYTCLKGTCMMKAKLMKLSLVDGMFMSWYVYVNTPTRSLTCLGYSLPTTQIYRVWDTLSTVKFLKSKIYLQHNL